MKIVAIIACLAGLGLALDEDDSEYDRCRNKCRDKFEQCYKTRCERLPEEERSKCWLECAGGEVQKCYESCEDKDRD